MSTPGPIATAIAAYRETLGFESNDPREALMLTAQRCAAVVDSMPMPPVGLVRELRQMLQWAGEDVGHGAGELDAIRARRAARRLDWILESLESGTNNGNGESDG